MKRGPKKVDHRDTENTEKNAMSRKAALKNAYLLRVSVVNLD